MTKTAVTTVLSKLGVSFNKWVELPTVSYISLVTDAVIFTHNATNYNAEFYFDSSNELLAERISDLNGKIIDYGTIFSFSEIICFVMMNKDSEAGHHYMTEK